MRWTAPGNFWHNYRPHHIQTPKIYPTELKWQKMIEYLLPIPYMRAPIDIELWIGRSGGARLEICCELYTPAGVEPRQLFTRAATTLVLVTAATGKPQRIPEELREAWAAYVEEPVAFTKRG